MGGGLGHCTPHPGSPVSGPLPSSAQVWKTGASGWSPGLPVVLRPVTISSAATVSRGPLGSPRSSHGGGHHLGRVGHGPAPPDLGLTAAGPFLHRPLPSLSRLCTPPITPGPAGELGVTSVPDTPRPRAPNPLILQGWGEGPLWQAHSPHPRGSPRPARTCTSPGLEAGWGEPDLGSVPRAHPAP